MTSYLSIKTISLYSLIYEKKQQKKLSELIPSDGRINNEYFIGDNQIYCSAAVKDLVVLISSNLK